MRYIFIAILIGTSGLATFAQAGVGYRLEGKVIQITEKHFRFKSGNEVFTIRKQGLPAYFRAKFEHPSGKFKGSILAMYVVERRKIASK